MCNPIPKTTVAAYISSQLASSDKTHREIAAEIGLPNANTLSMIGTSTLKLPIKRVGALAKALDIDPTHLLRLVLTEYAPDVLEAVESVLQRPLLSANEAALIDALRVATGGRDPAAVVIERGSVVAIVAA